MKLKIERRNLAAIAGSDKQMVSQNTLASRTLSALPGERFV